MDAVRMPETKTFKEIVGELIGEASMCWSETPQGVFDSTRAIRIVNDILDAKTRTMTRKEKLETQITFYMEGVRPLLSEWSKLHNASVE